MPNVVGLGVREAGERLQAMGFRVTVILPAQHFSSSEMESFRRVRIDDHRAFDIPKGTVLFREGPYRWPYQVASQEPTIGAEVRPGERVALSVGRHEGGDPQKRWLLAHAGVVKSEGTAKCFDCHKETECSDCHKK
jgi:hypothetical protein